jgi:hypothetical protein
LFQKTSKLQIKDPEGKPLPAVIAPPTPAKVLNCNIPG